MTFYLKCQKLYVHKIWGLGLQEVNQNMLEDGPTCLEENPIAHQGQGHAVHLLDLTQEAKEAEKYLVLILLDHQACTWTKCPCTKQRP